MNEGPDRHIELVLTFAITFFAFTQWVTSCENNDSTTEQTAQLINAATINAAASVKNSQAAADFSESAAKINRGIGNAVEQLQAQADNARNQLEHSDRQFQASQRPWLDIQATGVEFVIIGVNFGDANIEYSAFNTGSSTATNVSYLFFLILDGTETGQECTANAARQYFPGKNGNAVFPTERVIGAKTTINPVKQGINGDQFPDLRLIMCVVYHSQFDNVAHHTKRIYAIEANKATSKPYSGNTTMYTGIFRLVPMPEYTDAN